MKLTFLLLSLVLLSCKSSGYEKNKLNDFILIQLSEDNSQSETDQQKLRHLLSLIDGEKPRAIIIKPIIQTVDSQLLRVMAELKSDLYGSAAMDDEKGKVVNEEAVFRKSNLLLKRSFRKAIVPADTLIKLYKGVGIEAATFRNSGQLESYYVAIGLHGKTTASLPFLLVADLIGKDINEINPVKLFLSKNGTMPVRFSDPDAYENYHVDEVLAAADLQEKIAGKIVIVYQGTERIPTLQGAKLKSEITADVINQLINQLTR